MIHQHQRQHRFGDRHGTQTDAGIVAALGNRLHGLALVVDGIDRQPQAGGRFEGHADQDVLAAGNTAQDATRVVADEAIGAHRVAVRAPFLLDRSETGANFHALRRVDAHHRTGDIGIEPAENRFAEARRHAAGHDIDPGADRIARFSQRIHKSFELGHALRVRAEKCIVIGRRQVDCLQRQRPKLGQVTVDLDAQPAGQVFFCDGAGGDPNRGFPRRRAATAAIVANPVFLLISVVGMARAKNMLELLVVARALIDIFYQQADRRTRRLALENTGKYPHVVRFAPLTGVPRTSRPAPFEVVLQIFCTELQPRRAAIDYTADRRAVAFAKTAQHKQFTDAVSRHGSAAPVG